MGRSVGDRIKCLVHELAYSPAHGWVFASATVLGEAILSQLIIRFIRYTEIDWETYMHHVELYLKGERDYSAITGPTGHLVYPAGHVYVHETLYNITSSGLDIRLAQQLYSVLYLVSVVLNCAIYLQARRTPNWVLLLLPLSKRLHSIFVLRLFNDCWATVAAQAATFLLGAGYHSLACIIFSLAISIKMSVLLYLPGLFIILWQARGIYQTVLYVLLMVLLQVVLGWPFLSQYPSQYVSGAFDFSRVFLFKWTVNWRFLDEDVFLNPNWAKTLLLGHLCTLFVFAHFKWCAREGGITKLIVKTLRNPSLTTRSLSANCVTTVLYTSNLIGIIFARSLHYQFYSWYAQQIPFLAWSTPYPTYLKLCIIFCIEYAWNVFPSTTFSSALLVAVNILLLVGLWFGRLDAVAVPSQHTEESK